MYLKGDVYFRRLTFNSDVYFESRLNYPCISEEVVMCESALIVV